MTATRMLAGGGLGAIQAQLAKLQAQVDALSNASQGEALQPSYLTINTDGTVSATFSGVLTAEGLTVPASTATTPPASNQARWTDSLGDVVGRIFGFAGSTTNLPDDIYAQAIARGSADSSGAYLQALDDTQTTQAYLAATQVGRANGTVVAHAGALQNTVLDASGNSSFLQLPAAANRKIDFGSTSFPGNGTGNVSGIVIAHSLGVTPSSYWVGPNPTATGGFWNGYCAPQSVGAASATVDADNPGGAFTSGKSFGLFWIACA